MATTLTTVDSHYIVNAYGNEMEYQMTHYSNIDRGVPTSSNFNGIIALPQYHYLLMPYVQASTPIANVNSLEYARMNFQRYHDSIGSINNHIFSHLQYPIFSYQTRFVHETRGHSINFHPIVIAPSYRAPTNPSSSSSRSQPHRGNMHHTTPGHWRNLQVDDIPSLDDYSSEDYYSDLPLNIRDMSYEELLALEALEEQSGNLLEEIIARQMKTKTYLLPNNLEGETSNEQEFDLCVVCQDEYKNKEEIGILQCGHKYHADCIRKWLHEKNFCPICKSKALTLGSNQ